MKVMEDNKIKTLTSLFSPKFPNFLNLSKLTSLKVHKIFSELNSILHNLS